MRQIILITVVAALLLLALAAYFLNFRRYPNPVSLPGDITTLAAGYPVALQMKDQIARDTHLASIHVDFDHQGTEFSITEISYVFVSPEKDGLVLAISIDNVKHQAYVSLDAPDSPDNPPATLLRSPPLDLSQITQTLPEILEIAKNNGLNEFCALAPGKQGVVDLSLSSSESGPVWGISGDGWDEKGAIAYLAISIDAQTGNVLSHSLDKAVNRRP